MTIFEMKWKYGAMLYLVYQDTEDTHVCNACVRSSGIKRYIEGDESMWLQNHSMYYS